MLVAVGVVFAGAAAARSSAPERFLDSDEAKDKAYRQGCAITDYHDLVAGEDIDWAWTAPSTHVGAPGSIELKPIRNVSDVTDPDIAGKVEKDFQAAFQRIGKTVGKGGLVATACVVWMDRFDAGKAAIPFAGPHLMQAGIGVEISIADASGTVVAKVRDNGRQGHEPAEAAAAVVDRIVNYLRDH